MTTHAELIEAFGDLSPEEQQRFLDAIKRRRGRKSLPFEKRFSRAVHRLIAVHNLTRRGLSLTETDEVLSNQTSEAGRKTRKRAEDTMKEAVTYYKSKSDELIARRSEDTDALKEIFIAAAGILTGQK